MIQRRTLLAGALLASLPGLAAAKPTGTADDELRRHLMLAGGESKALMVLFYANWCSWCRVFDRLLADPAASTVMAHHFRILHMRAQEHDDAYKAMELPGAEALYRRYAPEGAGLPFLVVVDAAERPVVTSVATKSGENIGFPVQPDELDAFERMLKTAAPSITVVELKTIRDACVRMMARR